MRILLAEDHTIVRQGLRTVLEKEAGWTVVAETGDGLEAVRLADEHEPDVLVVVAQPLARAKAMAATAILIGVIFIGKSPVTFEFILA